MAGEKINLGSLTEADTCRLFVTPALHAAGWGQAPTLIGEQRTFADGRIIVTGGIVRRGKKKRADYILFHRRDFPIAVVEAKEASRPAEDGVQHADPKDLVASMRAREQDIMRLLTEIEALVSEV